MGITEKDKELILLLCERKISIEDFKTLTKFIANKEILKELLFETKNRINEYNDNNYFEALFWRLPKILTFKEKEEIYQEFLLQKFHHEHEEMASAFQTIFNNNTENIPILLKAIDNIPEYLEPEDFKYPYIRKIIYAIGAQPQPESLLALEKLASETNDIKIKELAYISLKKEKNTIPSKKTFRGVEVKGRLYIS